ncbi:MAG TPA: pirin family protein, partial [Streptomyces sp.]|nr:pirin family protein [Streptomyces sp.]
STPYALERSGAVLYVRRPAAGDRVALPDAPRSYAHVVRGAVALDGEPMGPGDAARTENCRGRELVAREASELLVWELG